MVNITTYDLLVPIVQSLNKTITSTKVEQYSDTQYKIYTCDTKWLTLNRQIEIGADTFKVVDIQPNEWILVSGDTQPSLQPFDIYSPFFVHGTVMASKAEFDQKLLSTDKTPMIWMHEITNERFFPLDENAIDRESQCDLFFLIDANFSDWKIQDHYKYAIMPMRNLLFQFEEVLRNYKDVGIYEDYEVLDHAKFGVYVSERGHPTNIFNAELSGSQLKISIPFLKTLENCCQN